jgi:hypothetical protein
VILKPLRDGGSIKTLAVCGREDQSGLYPSFSRCATLAFLARAVIDET